MSMLENLLIVFVAGLVTDLATGLGALPFFFVDDFSDRWNVGLWGVASGIMVAASLFGLVAEGLGTSDGGLHLLLVGGLLAGVLLVEVSDRVLDALDIGGDRVEKGGAEVDRDTELANARDGTGGGDPHAKASHHHGGDEAHDDTDPGHGDAGGGHGHSHSLSVEAFTAADLKKLLLILGILTVHSFPEGVAIGVSFANLGLEGGVTVFGIGVPVLAVFMTIAISIHNIPEGTAISIPMRALGLSKWRMVGAAVFSSLPQPIGAVIAFVFVRWAEQFLPFGYGFAAGAMVYLVATQFIPEALNAGRSLPNRGHRELAVGFAAGIIAMVPLIFL